MSHPKTSPPCGQTVFAAARVKSKSSEWARRKQHITHTQTHTEIWGNVRLWWASVCAVHREVRAMRGHTVFISRLTVSLLLLFYFKSIFVSPLPSYLPPCSHLSVNACGLKLHKTPLLPVGWFLGCLVLIFLPLRFMPQMKPCERVWQ